MKNIRKENLAKFATDLLTAGGFQKAHAVQAADLLVWANLRGVESHGVLRIPRYVEMVELGIVNPEAQPKIVRSFGATALMDGDRCPGAVGMNLAVETAVELSRKFGIGWCSARHIGHTGAIGYYAGKIAERGLVGIVMAAGNPAMIYYGSKDKAVSTNPIAISAPTSAGRDPVVLDISTATVAMGKITAAKDAGREIPTGWGVDENGAETTDPARLKAVLPIAGPKGSGLSLMIEILGSVLAGNAIVAPAIGGAKGSKFNGLVLAVAPQAFGEEDDFALAVDELGDAVSALPTAPGVDRVLLPGQRGFATARSRAEIGIPLAPGTASRLIALAGKLDVPIPPSLLD